MHPLEHKPCAGIGLRLTVPVRKVPGHGMFCFGIRHTDQLAQAPPVVKQFAILVVDRFVCQPVCSKVVSLVVMTMCQCTPESSRNLETLNNYS